ncbi:MAG: RNA pseudouridine synthase [Phascolarctobacterium sp.]|nr:RNA pseudouridine synthase [Phascolarctobacterium sp.]
MEDEQFLHKTCHIIDPKDFLYLTQDMIAYEDDFFLIIDKPPGMLIHPTTYEDGNTVYDLVERYYKARGLSFGLHPINRLDRNTSGLCVFAKEPIIQFWMSKRPVTKEYLAIVQGVPPCDKGIIEAPIARTPESIITRCVNFATGKYAKTAYEVISTKKDISLVRLRLFTGRTHQIRVHMAYIGCPLYNDNLYGTPGPQARHALHAYRLSFKHPVSDNDLEITRALAKDLQKVYDNY